MRPENGLKLERLSRTLRHLSFHKRWRATVLIALAIGVVATACDQGPKSEGVIIIDAVSQDGTVTMKGRMSFELNAQSGRLEPNYWKPENLFLFRVPTEKVGGVSAKAGEIYRVDANKGLVKVGTFDGATSNDDLVKRYARN